MAEGVGADLEEGLGDPELDREERQPDGEAPQARRPDGEEPQARREAAEAPDKAQPQADVARDRARPLVQRADLAAEADVAGSHSRRRAACLPVT